MVDASRRARRPGLNSMPLAHGQCWPRPPHSLSSGRSRNHLYELPLLQEFPDDFRYVLALQDGAAIGMADGFGCILASTTTRLFWRRAAIRSYPRTGPRRMTAPSPSPNSPGRNIPSQARRNRSLARTITAAGPLPGDLRQVSRSDHQCSLTCALKLTAADFRLPLTLASSRDSEGWPVCSWNLGTPSAVTASPASPRPGTRGRSSSAAAGGPAGKARARRGISPGAPLSRAPVQAGLTSEGEPMDVTGATKSP
jgi:hypothetical protein